MRSTFPERVERGRIRDTGPWSSAHGDRCGAFLVFCPPSRAWLKIIASQGDDEIPWEHVSVSLRDRVPTWDEMCWVKDQFFEEEETVLQFHPPRSEYVNFHPFCLHLWRPTHDVIPRPPPIAVGPLGGA